MLPEGGLKEMFVILLKAFLKILMVFVLPICTPGTHWVYKSSPSSILFIFCYLILLFLFLVLFCKVDLLKK